MNLGFFMKIQYEKEWHVRKCLLISATPLAGDILLKQLKYFEVMLDIIEFSPRVKNCRILSGLYKLVFMSHQIF